MSLTKTLKTLSLGAVALGLMTVSGPSIAGEHHDHDHSKNSGHHAKTGVEVKATKLTENLYVLQGKGGNVALLFGEDGTFLIDADYADVTPSIIIEVEKITGKKDIEFLVNTHWHNDHTGGNEIMGKHNTLIIAHHNVRKRLTESIELKVFDKITQPQPKEALPVITYATETAFHINNETIRVFHVENAHTDGDSVIEFTESNVIHAGDTYFNGFYPFIDTATGGGIEGMIGAVDEILELADDKTVIIPGHGPVSNKAELQAYRDMLVNVRDKVKPMVEAGKSLEQIKAAHPLAEFNAEWGDGFLPPEKWLRIVVESLKS